MLDMLIEPQLERRAYVLRHQAQRVATVQPLLDLALELRVEHLGAQHEAGAREHVFGHQLHALGQQRVQVDEGAHRGEQAFAQAGLMGAAGHRGNQVDVALAQRLAVFGEGHAPGRALALGDVFGLGLGGELLAFEQRDHRVAGERLRQVVAQAALEQPGLRCRRLCRNSRLTVTPGISTALLRSRCIKSWRGKLAALEVLGVGPHAHRGALRAVVGAGLALAQLVDHVAAGERHRRHLAVAHHGDLQPLGQRVGDADAHAVQAAREAVGAAGPLVELAAGVQAREHDLEHRHLLFGVQAEWDAAAVVEHRHRAVTVHRDGDALAVAGQRLVGRVVDHLLDHVQRVVGARVHAGPLLDRLEPLEDADRLLGVLALLGCHGARL